MQYDIIQASSTMVYNAETLVKVVSEYQLPLNVYLMPGITLLFISTVFFVSKLKTK